MAEKSIAKVLGAKGRLLLFNYLLQGAKAVNHEMSKSTILVVDDVFVVRHKLTNDSRTTSF